MATLSGWRAQSSASWRQVGVDQVWAQCGQVWASGQVWARCGQVWASAYATYQHMPFTSRGALGTRNHGTLRCR